MFTIGTLVKVIAGFYIGCTGYVSEEHKGYTKTYYLLQLVQCPTSDNQVITNIRLETLPSDQLQKIEGR